MEIRSVTRTSINTGLDITFLLDDFNLDSLIKTTIYKLSISIDNYTSLFDRQQIYDPKKGIDIPLGNTQIKMEREYFQNLPEPYNDCIKQDTLDYISRLFQYFIQNKFTYKQTNCFDFCIQEYLMSKCDCPGYFDSFQRCLNNHSSAQCIKDDYIKFQNKKIEMPSDCKILCPLECDSIKYKVEQNSFQIPDEYFQLMNMSSSQLNKTNYVNILINYQSNQYTLISQKPKMEIFDLISNVGGMISLFLGFSFLSLIEFIDVIFKICFSFFRKQNSISTTA
jgi:hypothetical protein